MDINELTKNTDYVSVGDDIYALIVKLFPICRSITGNGVRKTLRIIGENIPLKIHEVPTGTKVFDWTVPKEWNIRDAYVKDPNGEKIIDFNRSNLHVLNYSIPIHKKVPLYELKQHLFTLPEHPDWIPYKTSYYKDSWGFCLSHNQYLSLKDGDYEVLIDSTLEDGHLTYAECLISGKSENIVLISTHVCHPSMANDNLSGVSTATHLAKYIQNLNPRYTYRFLFIPGTIGAITWLAQNNERVSHIKHGLVLTGLGDPGKLTYKKSRRGDALIDRVSQYILQHHTIHHNILDFSPYGYDERQYCSPGFNLPVGRLSRTPFGVYPQYHTSADDLDFVQPYNLSKSFEVLIHIIDVIEHQATFTNQNPFCEPQLGKRGIYDVPGKNEMALLWVLNMSDGANSLLDIAELAGLPFSDIHNAAKILEKNALLIRADD